MNEMEKAFDENYAKYGGIYLGGDAEVEKNIVKELESIREKVNDYYKDKKVAFFTPSGVETKMIKNLNVEAGEYHPHINVFVADNDEINAFAGKINDDYYIGILKGVFLQLRNHIKNYVEDEAFEKIPEIGQCYPEAILNILTNNCMDFLTFHEFFHIMNGHCDYRKSIGLDELCEVNTDCTENGMIFQTLEFDADCCAISSMVKEYFRTSYMIIQSIPGVTGRPNIDSTIQFISELLVSTYMLNHWLNTRYNFCTEFTEKTLEDMTHPLPGIRTFYIWATISTVLLQCEIYNKQEIDEILSRSINAVMTFAKEFSDIAYPSFLKVAFDEVGKKHLQKLHDSWKDVRELLVVHYAELAPYEKANLLEE